MVLGKMRTSSTSFHNIPYLPRHTLPDRKCLMRIHKGIMQEAPAQNARKYVLIEQWYDPVQDKTEFSVTMRTGSRGYKYAGYERFFWADSFEAAQQVYQRVLR